ncbi:MAG: hypothetical protein WDO14_12000 [Bacteroidota bacterium]
MDFVEIAGVSILVTGGLTCCVLILYALRQTKLREQHHAEMKARKKEKKRLKKLAKANANAQAMLQTGSPSA